ncbi:MAG: NAD(P)-binding domain-containing protein, partial [Acidaminococcaceae bacterium]|nr:NAD(P)-binding domain-containing protein [Acidaminococcaceae bacterium]
MDLKNKIVICSGKIRPVAVAYLQDKVTLKSWQQRGRVPEEQWNEWLQEADALYSAGNIRIDEKLLQKAPKLRVVAQSSVGYDNIDVEACHARSVKIGNTPGVLVNAVADIAYGLLIDTARGMVRGHLHTKNGLWGERKAMGLGVDLYNKTLGVVGFGDIGSAIAKRAQASGMRIIYHNRNRRLNDAALGARYVSWEELLKTSDFIVVAV